MSITGFDTGYFFGVIFVAKREARARPWQVTWARGSEYGNMLRLPLAEVLPVWGYVYPDVPARDRMQTALAEAEKMFDDGYERLKAGLPVDWNQIRINCAMHAWFAVNQELCRLAEPECERPLAADELRSKSDEALRCLVGLIDRECIRRSIHRQHARLTDSYGDPLPWVEEKVRRHPLWIDRRLASVEPPAPEPETPAGNKARKKRVLVIVDSTWLMKELENINDERRKKGREELRLKPTPLAEKSPRGMLHKDTWWKLLNNGPVHPDVMQKLSAFFKQYGRPLTPPEIPQTSVP